MEIGDALQSLLYGQLTVDIRNPTYLEQLEIVRVIVANPSAPERCDMIEKAQIILQPSFIKPGPDEALLEGIKTGRHCITNSKSSGSPYAPCYHQGSSASAFQEIIVQLYHHPFSEEEIETRKRAMSQQKSNATLAEEFTTIVWG